MLWTKMRNSLLATEEEYYEAFFRTKKSDMVLSLISHCSAGSERFSRVGGVELHLTPHFVPEGISSSMRDFIILVLIFEALN